MKNVVGIQFVLFFQDRIETDRKTIERIFVNFLFQIQFSIILWFIRIYIEKHMTLSRMEINSINSDFIYLLI